MLSLVKATSPPPTNTSRHSRTIGRRVNPNARMDLIKTNLHPTRPDVSRATAFLPAAFSARGRGERVAEKNRAVRGNEFARLHPFEDLVISVALHADLDRAPYEVAAIGRHPYGHGAVALAHHAVERDGHRPHRVPGADDEIGEHAGAQLVARIGDLGTDQRP